MFFWKLVQVTQARKKKKEKKKNKTGLCLIWFTSAFRIKVKLKLAPAIFNSSVGREEQCFQHVGIQRIRWKNNPQGSMGWELDPLHIMPHNYWLLYTSSDWWSKFCATKWLHIGSQPKTSCCLSCSKHSWEPRCGSVQCITELRRPRQKGHKFKTRLVTQGACAEKPPQWTSWYLVSWSLCCYGQRLNCLYLNEQAFTLKKLVVSTIYKCSDFHL